MASEAVMVGTPPHSLNEENGNWHGTEITHQGSSHRPFFSGASQCWERALHAQTNPFYMGLPPPLPHTPHTAEPHQP
jgi:hypothetical protein